MRKLFPWNLPALILLAGLLAALLGTQSARVDVKPSATTTTPAAVEVSAKPRLRLMFVGDIMLSRLVGQKIEASGDWRYPFLNIATTTREADLAFANLETSVSDRGRKVGSIYSFRSDPRTMEGLKYAGFDVVSVANNHIWDYSTEAFLDTLRHLREAGIVPVGGGEDYEKAHAPVVLDARGVRVAYLAYTNLLPSFFTRPSSTPASAAYDDWERVKRDIQSARAQADLVVVSYHWGEEYHTKHGAAEEKVAHDTIDAGADLVIGAHPHVQQEIERYTSVTSGASRNGWIAYSLGNFVFDQHFQPEVIQSRILEINTEGAVIVGVKIIPVTIPRTCQPEVTGNPVILSGSEGSP